MKKRRFPKVLWSPEARRQHDAKVRRRNKVARLAAERRREVRRLDVASRARAEIEDARALAEQEERERVQARARIADADRRARHSDPDDPIGSSRRRLAYLRGY